MKKPVVAEEFESELNSWVDQEKKAVDLQNTLGQLLYGKSVELVLFRNRITNITKSEILNLHDYAAKFVKQDINVHQTLNLAKAILKLGIKNTKIDLGKLTYEWIKGFVKLISFDVDKKDIAGPIGIAKISGNAISLGLPNFLFLMALLSINLGLINLLPIPALDGGYILMYFTEFILGRPINQKIQSKLIQIGVFFLMLLMIVITFFDIQKLFV